jgi:TonB-linked SusC/RagA family outer membrane protein
VNVRTSAIVYVAVGIATWIGAPLAAQAKVPASAAPPVDAPLTMPLSAGPVQQATVQASNADTSPLERRVSLDVRNALLKDVLKEINRQARLGLAYTPRVVPTEFRVSIRATDITAKDALERVLRGTGVKIEMTGSGSVMLVKGSARRAEAPVDSARYGAVWGHVTDSAASQPLAGTLMGVKGTTLTSVTNAEGNYVFLGVPFGVHVITARHLGYAPTVREVAIVDSQLVRLDFVLHMGMSRLQEVVTTATGQQRRLELGNDITVINADSIARTQPVSSVTQLLEARVPGLVVQHTSGAPGDPSRLRLRGAASVYRSNDPIVIVDGVRVYSAQSDQRSANLASPAASSLVGANSAPAAAPSPLDQIDPNSIETIEVLKGPSAATLYGADAANGVIVITTKRGKVGPPRWAVSAERGLTFLPGKYPAQYFRWGHNLDDNASRWCPVIDLTCKGDSVARFQALNDPELTSLGHGERSAMTVGVTGGSATLQYALTGSASDDIGLLTLPGFAAQSFQAAQGSAPPSWMRRPQDYKTFSGTSRITAQLGPSADVSLTTQLSRGEQQRSSLESQIGSLMYTYVDPATGTYRTASGSTGAGGFTLTPQLLSGFYQRTTDVATTFANGVNANWHPHAWLTASTDAGLQLINREDEVLLPRDYSSASDSVGLFNRGSGRSLVGTVNLRGTLTAPPLWGVMFRTAVGANYTSTSITDAVYTGTDIPVGATAPDQATQYHGGETQSTVQTLGWYVEPTLSTKRLFLSTGLRFDGGNTFGTHASLVGFPKVGLSYVISDEPFFPFKSLFQQLRLRVAYGHAGVQPGPGDWLRLYSARTRVLLDSQAVDITRLVTLGNTQLKPERSAELEGGFDADLLNDRLSLGVTGYRKTREDALMQLPLPPSIYGEGAVILKNIGVIRNTGLELTLGTELVRSAPVTWSAQLQFSRNRNVVVSLGPGVDPFSAPSAGVLSAIRPGYPLYGIWARPIVGYADANQDGVLEPNEVQVGDSAAYMGSTSPDYEASLHTGLSLFRGAIHIDAGFDYQHGVTQINVAGLDHLAASRALNDPSAPSGELAGVLLLVPANALDFNSRSGAYTPYGVVQTVNTLRFNSLSMAYALPTAAAQRVGARALTVALQGTNLGLFTNYHGKDPNVNAYPSGNGLLDTGQLPAPRTWQLRVSAQY